MKITLITLLTVTGAACSLAAFAARRALEGALRRLREEDLFGKYRLGEVLGTGGMGGVLAATDCPEGGFERPVAIKWVRTRTSRAVRGLWRASAPRPSCAGRCCTPTS